MDINRLRYFTVIAQLGSLSKASEHLRISQPALSKAMKVLESELGFALFIAQGRGLILTDQAQKLIPRIQSILTDVDQLTQPEVAKESNNLRIGSFEVFTTHFIGRLISNYFPESSVDLHELIPGQIEEALIKKQIDYGITYLPIPTPDLDFHEIAKIKMVVAGPQALIHHNKLETLPFVVPITPITGSPTKVKGLDGWPDDRIPRQIKYRVTMMESALELCRQGLAAAYLPEFVVRLHNETCKNSAQLHELNISRLEIDRAQSIYLMKRKSDIEGTVYKRLAKAIRKIV